jgi:hypothetical protein
LKIPGDEDNGITVRSDGDGFVLKNVIVQNFEENGVFMIRADNFLLSHVDTKNNGEYGLFPLFCNGGLIEHCSAQDIRTPGFILVNLKILSWNTMLHSPM